MTKHSNRRLSDLLATDITDGKKGWKQVRKHKDIKVNKARTNLMFYSTKLTKTASQYSIKCGKIFDQNLCPLANTWHAYELRRIRDSSVGIVTDYGLDGRGSITGRSYKLFSSSQWPDWLWGPSSLQDNGYRGLFLRGWRGWGVKLTIHRHLVPSWRMVELYLHSSVYVHSVVLY
jgi:hypothetical protein